MPNKQNRYTNIRTTKKNCIRPTQQYGMTKHADKKQLTPSYFIIIIIIIINHGLGLLTCSGIDALPSFPGASTISSSSTFVRGLEL